MSIVELGWNNNVNESRNNSQKINADHSIINLHQSAHKLNQMIGTYNSHINNQKKMIMKRM